jgi:hypothetical protein
MRHGIFYLLILLAVGFSQADGAPLPKRQEVLGQAQHMLENWSISYVMGGNKLGDVRECEACNQCLGAKKPDKDSRLRACPTCASCSLDCSHFIYEVFKLAGLPATYLTTALMNNLGADALLKKYSLVDVGNRSQRALPGDLLVYDGHVVMLEKKHPKGLGDIIHVTSGRDLRGPGLGIQRERLVAIDHYRGPLLRVLRHVDLVRELRDFTLSRSRVLDAKTE